MVQLLYLGIETAFFTLGLIAIMTTLNNWRDDVRKRRMIRDVYSFKEFIIKHKSFEEEKVYPKLDESLPEDEKRHIVAKINEIVQR